MQIQAQRFYTRGPADTEALAAALHGGAIDAREVIAVIGKTEGNGGGNDFTRELAMRALCALFAPLLDVSEADVEQRIVFSFSGGSEGVVSPHMLVLARRGQAIDSPLPDKHLAVATGCTRDFSAAETGYRPMVDETARVVRALMQEVGVDDPADVHLVQIKGAIPDYSFEQAQQAEACGRPLRSNMVYSRGASALGVALALGEVDAERISDAAIGSDWDLYSSVASTSSKPGLARSEITLFANSHYWDGDLRIAHGVMRDIIDIDAIRAVLQRLGLASDGQLNPAQQQRLVGLFAKADADPRHTLRGRRHTMWSDADISDMRYSRCVVAALLAGLSGDTAVYVSTRAEHHGPLGGGPVAIIARDAP